MKREEIGQDIVAYSSNQTGPCVAVIGCVHGNERLGGDVVRCLHRALAPDARPEERLEVASGKLILAIGNPRAAALNTRFVERDLNRCFTTAVLAGEGSAYECVRARELAAALAAADYVIDLHCVNKRSAPFLAFQDYVDDFFCPRFNAGVQKATIDPGNVLGGETCTLDGWAQRRGARSVCYEVGQVGERSFIRMLAVASEAAAILSELGVVAAAVPVLASVAKDIFRLTEQITLTPAGFRWAPGMGTHSFQEVRPGQIIGYHGEQALAVPGSEGSFILWPKVESLWAVGQPLGFLAARIPGPKDFADAGPTGYASLAKERERLLSRPGQ